MASTTLHVFDNDLISSDQSFIQKLCTRSKAQQQCRNQVSMHEFSGTVTLNVALD